jgi:hypothetical protein
MVADDRRLTVDYYFLKPEFSLLLITRPRMIGSSFREGNYYLTFPPKIDPAFWLGSGMGEGSIRSNGVPRN